jgi:hypothetical protein
MILATAITATGATAAFAAWTLNPIMVAANGTDSPTCGGSTDPCGSMRYAVNVRANSLEPVDSVAAVVLGEGYYGPGSCSTNATRPISIVGAGSGATVVDCGGTDRALYTNASITMFGLTITGGAVSIDFNDTGVNDFDVRYASGGGGVAVVWSEGGANAVARFEDVVWLNNTVRGVVTGTGDALVVFGGGGVSVFGGGGGGRVAFDGCVSVNNTVDAPAYDSAGGGGFSIVFYANGDAESVSNVNVSLENVNCSSNSAGLCERAGCVTQCSTSASAYVRFGQGSFS